MNMASLSHLMWECPASITAPPLHELGNIMLLSSRCRPDPVHCVVSEVSLVQCLRV